MSETNVIESSPSCVDMVIEEDEEPEPDAVVFDKDETVFLVEDLEQKVDVMNPAAEEQERFYLSTEEVAVVGQNGNENFSENSAAVSDSDDGYSGIDTCTPLELTSNTSKTTNLLLRSILKTNQNIGHVSEPETEVEGSNMKKEKRVKFSWSVPRLTFCYYPEEFISEPEEMDTDDSDHDQRKSLSPSLIDQRRLAKQYYAVIDFVSLNDDNDPDSSDEDNSDESSSSDEDENISSPPLSPKQEQSSPVHFEEESYCLQIQGLESNFATTPTEEALPVPLSNHDESIHEDDDASAVPGEGEVGMGDSLDNGSLSSPKYAAIVSGRNKTLRSILKIRKHNNNIGKENPEVGSSDNKRKKCVTFAPKNHYREFSRDQKMDYTGEEDFDISQSSYSTATRTETEEETEVTAEMSKNLASTVDKDEDERKINSLRSSEQPNDSLLVKGRYKCPVPRCRYSFKRRDTILSHQRRMHDESRQIQCPQCSCRFMNHSCLQRHKSEMHPEFEKSSTCEVCGATFSRYSNKINHMKRVHSSSRNDERNKLKCSDCSGTFPTKSELNAHLSKAHGRARSSWISCPFCERIFLCFSALDNHMRIHTGEQPFECGKCQTWFKRKSTLRKHKLREKH